MKIEDVPNSDENKNNKPDESEIIANLMNRLEELEKKDKSTRSEDDNNQANLIKDLTEAIKGRTDTEKYGGESFYVDPEDLDPEDIVDPGVSFYSHKVMYVIVDDRRQGLAVRTPFGKPIIFNYQSTKKVGTGKEAKLHNLSVYTSFSKKEINWLKECKGYGSVFFDTHTSALSTDSRKAEKLARIMNVLDRYNVAKISRLAEQNGIPQSMDPRNLKLAIANKQADDEILKENSQNEIRLKEAVIESEILGDSSTSAIAGALKNK